MPNRYEVTYEIGEPCKQERTVLWHVRNDGADVVATYPIHLSLSEAIREHNTPATSNEIVLELKSLRDKIEANTWGLNHLEKLILQTMIAEKLTSLGEV